MAYEPDLKTPLTEIELAELLSSPLNPAQRLRIRRLAFQRDAQAEALLAAKEFVAGCDGACDCQYREGGPCDWCKLTALITTALEET